MISFLSSGRVRVPAALPVARAGARVVVVHAVLVVVALVGGVQVPVVDVVDVVAVGHGGVSALGAVLVRMGLGDVVRRLPASGTTPVTTAVTTKSPTASSTMVPPEGVLSG